MATDLTPLLGFLALGTLFFAVSAWRVEHRLRRLTAADSAVGLGWARIWRYLADRWRPLTWAGGIPFAVGLAGYGLTGWAGYAGLAFAGYTALGWTAIGVWVTRQLRARGVLRETAAGPVAVPPTDVRPLKPVDLTPRLLLWLIANAFLLIPGLFLFAGISRKAGEAMPPWVLPALALYGCVNGAILWTIVARQRR